MTGGERISTDRKSQGVETKATKAVSMRRVVVRAVADDGRVLWTGKLEEGAAELRAPLTWPTAACRVHLPDLDLPRRKMRCLKCGRRIEWRSEPKRGWFLAA